jgi:hypothetical protein
MNGRRVWLRTGSTAYEKGLCWRTATEPDKLDLMMSRRAWLALLVVAGCATGSADRWQRSDDRTPPTASETFYCHDEAQRQAGVRYPGQPPREQRGLPRIEDQREFPAEIRFFEQCMTRQGFVRASAPLAAPAR